jgi:hypothetical protein
MGRDESGAGDSDNGEGDVLPVSGYCIIVHTMKYREDSPVFWGAIGLCRNSNFISRAKELSATNEYLFHKEKQVKVCFDKRMVVVFVESVTFISITRTARYRHSPIFAPHRAAITW